MKNIVCQQKRILLAGFFFVECKVCEDASGVVRCVYESFVPGVWHRWLEKEILWFCFRRAEPERMISGWTASSRDSSKTEEGKAPGVTDKFAPNSE